jgi:LEA14-like dessication related protein
MRKTMRNCVAAVALISMAISGCAGKLAPGKLAQKPSVNLRSVRLEDLSFEALQLVADLQIKNPNPFGISLAGLDYRLEVSGHPLLSGTQQGGLKVPAEGEGAVQLPVQIIFHQLHEALGALADADSADYALEVGLRFELPIVGQVNVPLKHSARLPVLKLPEVHLQGIRLKRLSLSAAEIGLVLGVSNPNALSFSLQGLEYSLDVHGARWLSGFAEQLGQVPAKGSAELELPATIDFAQLGRAAYRLLASGGSLPYRLRGKIELGSVLPFFRAAPIAFDKSGEASLLR